VERRTGRSAIYGESAHQRGERVTSGTPGHGDGLPRGKYSHHRARRSSNSPGSTGRAARAHRGALENRILRVRNEPWLVNRAYGRSYEERRAAQDLIGANDLASADYLRRFYHVDWSDPSLYHLIVNTGKLNVEQATQLIVAAVRELEPAVREA